MLYDFDGNEITNEEFSKLRKEKGRIGDETLIDGIRISTVYLGVDHGWVNEKPIIFETMVFMKDSYDDMQCERYVTLEEAEAGHKKIVAKWKDSMLQRARDKQESAINEATAIQKDLQEQIRLVKARLMNVMETQGIKEYMFPDGELIKKDDLIQMTRQKC